MNNALDPQENTAIAPKKDKKKKGQYFLLLPILLLVFLFVLTFILLVFRVGGFLPSDDVFYISRAKPGLRAGDDEQIWQNHTSIAIFRVEYENGERIITVSSALGKDIIAPGTSNEYNFYLRNTGNSPIAYGLTLDASITVDGYEGIINEIPVNVKLRRYDNAYLIGGEDKWIPVSELGGGADAGTLGANSYASYTLYWQWEFETGNDFWDTFLGAASVDSSIQLTISIGATSAEPSGPVVPGGIPNGCHCRRCYCLLLLILVLILIIAEVVTLIVLFHYVKKCKKGDAEETDENAADGKETSEAEAPPTGSADGESGT